MINVVAKITTDVLIVAGIGLASGVIPHAWRYAGDHANGFWILAAILFLLEAVCLLFTFKALYRSGSSDGLGPRSSDILRHCLTLLAARSDASLVMLPLLLTNLGFRRSVTRGVMASDPFDAA
ncbi:hypothetical protein [Mycobacteroides chelonae]|uniref:hypothetical protein n=1 Tax=Mycobacteroides chelonae TaxID=1774 RepID=UPI0008A87FDB|nr:hypothetical protein BKG78_23270 [Mycobacteroides chelonae]